MSTDVKGRRGVQGAATRDALVAAARRLFGNQGYSDTPIEQIVAEAGVTKGALYHHFADKESVFRAVFEEVQREVSDKAAAEFMQPESWHALIAGCRLWIDAHLDPPVRQIVLTDARAVLGSDSVRAIETRFSTVALRGALRKAMHAGVLERRPLRPLAFMLVGALGEACLYVAEAEDPDTARREVNDLLAALLSGLRVRTERALEPGD
ncbi:MAG: TetR/AcrR family transcriptional regulator [Acidimicrobiia bacterium]|nr:TetR/AcrR family transcriptional regulator [Acidimicrobiia bacterium]